MSKAKTHKMNLIKARPGHNPMKPLCESDEGFAFMAKEWKDVNCRACRAKAPWRKDVTASRKNGDL